MVGVIQKRGDFFHAPGISGENDVAAQLTGGTFDVVHQFFLHNDSS